MLKTTFASMWLTCLFAVSASADDWPQWLGPQRDSVWRETGIVKQFPKSGLPVKWRVPVQLGYSGPAVWGGKVFLTDYVKAAGTITNNPGGRDQLKGRERVLCFSAGSGELLWQHDYERDYAVSYGSGPRCTPTVADGKVYTLGAEGDLLCLSVDDGQVVWQTNLKEAYQAETPMWGFSAHPLVVGDLLYLVAGGSGGVAVALNKDTGKDVWRALSGGSAGYCPPTLIEHAGKQQLLIWKPDSINSLHPGTGDVYWSLPLKPSYGMSVTAPRLAGDTLFASGIGSVGALMKLDAKKPAAEFLWHGKSKTAVYCCNSTPIIDGGIIFGNDCQTGKLMAVKLADGERLWETLEPTAGGKRRASHGTAYLVKHADRYFLFSETGDLIVAKLSADGYSEISRFHVLDPTNDCFGREVVWSHPAFAERSVFARSDKELVCVDLAE